MSVKSLLRAITPYGLVNLRRGIHAGAVKYDWQRTRYDALTAVQSLQPAATLEGTDYEALIRYLMSRGLQESQLRGGSMPEVSLSLIREHLYRAFAADNDTTPTPLFGLHIGNFVGVSLAYLSAILVHLNAKSIMISVDPNLPHRGIESPQTHVLSLLSRCGLQKNSVIITGYSGQKSISNDATTFGNYNPVEQYLQECAGENTVENLVALCGSKLHFAMLDGNHEASYLRPELRQIKPLLHDNAIIVLDDVCEEWQEITEVFDDAEELGFSPVASDGRIGILQMTPTAAFATPEEQVIQRPSSSSRRAAP